MSYKEGGRPAGRVLSNFLKKHLVDGSPFLLLGGDGLSPRTWRRLLAVKRHAILTTIANHGVGRERLTRFSWPFPL